MFVVNHYISVVRYFISAFTFLRYSLYIQFTFVRHSCLVSTTIYLLLDIQILTLSSLYIFVIDSVHIRYTFKIGFNLYLVVVSYPNSYFTFISYFLYIQFTFVRHSCLVSTTISVVRYSISYFTFVRYSLYIQFTFSYMVMC